MPAPSPGHSAALGIALTVLLPFVGGCQGEEADTAEASESPPADAFVFTDQYTETAAVCDWAAYRDAWFGTEEYGTSVETPAFDVPAYSSEACVDRVLLDFHVDVAAFLAVDEVADPYALVRSDGPSSRLGLILEAGRGLMLFDSGRVDELEAGGAISSAYVDLMKEVAESTGVETVAAAQYNFMTSIIRGVVVAEGSSPASFRRATREVEIHEPWTLYNPLAVALMMHEARHAYPGTGHLLCHKEVYETQCDVDLDGPAGFELASLVAAREGYESSIIRSSVRSNGWRAMLYINLCTDEDGILLEEWQQIHDETFPEE